MKRFIAILLLCLVIGTPMVAAVREHPRAEIGSTRIVIATAIRLLQWQFGILPTSDGLTPPIPAPNSDGLFPPIPRPASDGLIPPVPRPTGRTSCCK